MYNEKIEDMIMTARRAGEKDIVLVYQAVKNEFLKFKTAKNAGNLDDAAEINIIRKMVKEREESYNIYKEAGRLDIANKEKYEADVLKLMLPAEPTEEDIKKEIDAFIVTLGDVVFDRKQMGNCIKYVKSKIPTVDGRTLSTLVQKYF